MTAVSDVGKIGNILTVESQAYKGISHGALKNQHEDLKIYASMAGAGVQYILEIPDNIEIVFLGNARQIGPFDSSGWSGLHQSGGHMPVINAINNTVGVRIYELPVSPKRPKRL